MTQPDRLNVPVVCQLPGEDGQPICIRTVGQVLCSTCPDGPAEFTGPPAPEWLALLDRAGTDEAREAVCDAYSLGLRRGVERMEQSTELEAVRVGLDTEQEIRRHALDLAVQWTSLLGEGVQGPVLDCAETFAAYIRDGSHPAPVAPNGCDHCSVEPGETHYACCPTLDAAP